MQKRHKHRDITPEQPTQSELWRQWSERGLILEHAFTRQKGLERKSDVYNWLYELGIQPDRYIIRKSPMGRGHIEIRFKEQADLAWIKMSGHAELDKTK